MGAKAEYRQEVERELAGKVTGRAAPSLARAHSDLIDLGFRAQVHPRACAGVIAFTEEARYQRALAKKAR